MAQELWDDLEPNTRADKTVPFAFNGQNYELDLSNANAAAFERVLSPYIARARQVANQPHNVVVYLSTVGHSAGMLQMAGHAVGCDTSPATSAITSSNHLDHDRHPRPTLLQATASPQPPLQPTETPDPTDEQEDKQPAPVPEPAAETPTGVKDRQIREWAKLWSVPLRGSRGRVPARVRTAYEAFEDDDRAPWAELLKKEGIDPAKAQAKAEAEIEAAAQRASKEAAGPTQEEIYRKHAEQVGNLRRAQIKLLRLMFNAENGCVEVSSKDATSAEALRKRECCIRLSETTYAITEVGKLWFEVQGISPHDD